MRKIDGHEVSHLTSATQNAIHIFSIHHHKRFYTDRMVKVETEVMQKVPQSEMAEFVRITTAIQNGEPPVPHETPREPVDPAHELLLREFLETRNNVTRIELSLRFFTTSSKDAEDYKKMMEELDTLESRLAELEYLLERDR